MCHFALKHKWTKCQFSHIQTVIVYSEHLIVLLLAPDYVNSFISLILRNPTHLCLTAYAFP